MEHSGWSICVIGNGNIICGLLGEEYHVRMLLLIFFWAKTEQRKEASKILNKVFSWSKSKINKSNLIWFRCEKHKPIKKHL